MNQLIVDERGTALVVALLSTVLLTALGLSLTLTTSTELRIAATYRESAEVLYAADAALAQAIGDLSAAPDWSLVLAGLSQSSFVDGPAGARTMPDGSVIDLSALTAIVNCAKTSCTDDDLNAVGEDRPWGANNPRWQLYAHGPMPQVGSPIGSPRIYIVVWVADDPLENDGMPLVDGGPAPAAENPGRGVLSLLAHAYGPTGTRRIIEAQVARTAIGSGVRMWRELR